MAEQQEIHRLGAQTRSLPPPLQSLLSYWLQQCGGRRMPGRDDLPVQALRPWLGHLALIDPAAANRFTIRLCGTNLIRRFGREATGLAVEELAPDIAQQLRDILKAVSRALEPVVAVSPVPLGRTTYWHVDVALPLSGGRQGDGMFLLGSYPTREG